MNGYIDLKCIDLTNLLFYELSVSTDDCYCFSCLSSTLPFNHIEDDAEFSLYLRCICGSHMNFSNLTSLVFNPFDIDIVWQMLNSSDYDPDSNFLTGSTMNIDSIYIYPCELHETKKKSKPWLLRNTLIVEALNIN